MYKIYNLHYGCKYLPSMPTVELKIDTNKWCFGISVNHYKNMYRNSIDTVIEILFFSFRFSKFFIQMYYDEFFK